MSMLSHPMQLCCCRSLEGRKSSTRTWFSLVQLDFTATKCLGPPPELMIVSNNMRSSVLWLYAAQNFSRVWGAHLPCFSDQFFFESSVSAGLIVVRMRMMSCQDICITASVSPHALHSSKGPGYFRLYKALTSLSS